MRKSVFVLLCCLGVLLTGNLHAQDIPDSEQPQVEERTAINFYGGLLAEAHSINKQLGWNMGAEIGITYLDHFYVGGYYVALVSQHFRTDIPDHLSEKLRASFNHGGLIAGYVWKPQSLMNLDFGLRAGWGSVWYFDPMITNSDKLDEIYRGTRDRIFVLTPQVEYTITPIQWIRIGIGIGYRAVLGLDRYTYKDYNSPVGVISFSFGSFKGVSELSKEEVVPEP